MYTKKSNGMIDKTFLKAVDDGDINQVKSLLAQGANINCTNQEYLGNENTALHLAARRGHLEIVKLLVSAGATIDAVNSSRQTPLYFAAYELEEGTGGCNFAENKTTLPLIIKFLLQQGASFTGNNILRFKTIFAIANELKIDHLVEQLAQLRENQATSKELQQQVSQLQSEQKKFQEQLDTLKVQAQYWENRFALQEKEKGNLTTKIKELTTEITSYKERIKNVEEQQHILGLENNQLQKELEANHHLIRSLQIELKELRGEMVINTYPDNTKQAIKIQSQFRGWYSRMKQPLSELSKERQQEIKEKSPEVIRAFMQEGKYQEAAKLASAIQYQRWHEASQIIRNIPEKEMQSKSGLTIKY